MNILSQLMNESTRLEALIALLYRLPAVLIALTLHELAHGYAALKCGDPTAQMLGRLTFNPLKHLDPIGTLFMFLFGFGWARPVPINPRNYRHFRRDDFLVSGAGILMNLMLFLFATLMMILLSVFLYDPSLWQAGPLATRADFLCFEGTNFAFTYSNMGLVALKDAGAGYVYTAEVQDFLRTPWLMYVQRFLMDFSMVNIGLALFNLLPIPPMDGYRLLNDVLAKGKLHIPQKVMNGIMVGMLVLFFATDIFSSFLGKAIYFVQGGVVKGLLSLFGMA